MLAAVVLAVPDLDVAAARGEYAFAWIMGAVLPGRLALVLNVGIVLAQYVCGLAALTSASRMAFAFARDGGLPGSRAWRLGLPPAADTGRCRLGDSHAGGAVHAEHSRLCDDQRRLHDLPLPLLHAPHGARSVGPWAELDEDGTVEPGALVSPPGVRQRAGMRTLDRHRHAAALRAGRHDRRRCAVALAAGWFLCERRRFPGPPPVRDEEA